MFMNSKSLVQTAALPFIRAGRGIEVALITSRERRRWIVPKGWPVDGLSLSAAAAREAEEEAGLVGHVSETSIGAFDYVKQTAAGYGVPCRVMVYPMETTMQLLDWPERGERKLRWRKIAAAAEIVSDKSLGRLLSDLARRPHLLEHAQE